MTKVAALLVILALLFVGYAATAPTAGAQGCGCEMPPTMATEPASPTPTAWATLAAPPLPPTPEPNKPVRPPTEGNGSTYVYLPIVGGGAG